MKQREVGRRSYGAMMVLLVLFLVLYMGVFAGDVSGAEKRYRPKSNQVIEGLAQMKIDGKWGYVDPEGLVVIDPKFEEAQRFYQGLAAGQLLGERVYICVYFKILYPFA